jgi:tetratricopeptide (TPR) repeat protein
VRGELNLKLAICVALVAITWVVFGQTLGHPFVNYDDNTYVYLNSNVSHGLTLSGLTWTFTHFENGNWHPLTFISHMLDCQLFGLNAAGHHLTSVLLHTVAVVLLFLLLHEMTSALWASAFVAAIFAIHPLHVEAVAWVAERKGVLSGVFFMLTLISYVWYARRPSIGRYIAMSILFVLGLMSKPTLVPVPVVLLLLDYWPLRRSQSAGSTGAKLFVEKLPLFFLSLVFSIATLFAQKTAIAGLEDLSFTPRANNALAAYSIYIWQMIWPANLALFYPFPGPLPAWKTAGASVLLVSITGYAFLLRKKYPYFITGWCWYLVMLLPVIGLVQIAGNFHADRYTYLSQIGLYMVAAWGLADFSVSWPYRREALGAASIIVIAALMWRASTQTSYWSDNERLLRRTLALTEENDFVHLGLGIFLLEHQRVDEAIAEFRVVLAGHPNNPAANFQLASALVEKGDLESAVEHYRRVIAGGSDTATVHNALGDVLLRQGKPDAASNEFQRALKVEPANSKAETALGNILLEQGHGSEAIEHYRNVLRLEPSSPLAHYNLAVGLHRQGLLDEAILHYKATLAIQPNYPDAESLLGQALLQNGQLNDAKTHLEKH